MSITWSKYFDRIYCLHYVPFKERKKLMDSQLNKIGIMSSGIFEYYFTYAEYLNKKFNAYMEGNVFKRDVGKATLGHYDIIKDAYFRGYNHILVFEDDTKFTEDLNKIQETLQHKSNSNIILYNMDTKCYQLDRKGMKRFIKLIEDNPYPIKNYFEKADEYFKDLEYSSIENIVSKIQNIQPEKLIFSKEVKIVDELKYNLDDQVEPADLNICFAITCNHYNKLNTAMYSFKKYTNKNSKLHFHIITDIDDFSDFKKQISKLEDQRTDIKFADCSDIIKAINPKFNHFHTLVSYMPMFIPTIFSDVDKMLYFDYDTFVNREGIERLFNLDIDDYYFIATEDALFLKNGFFSSYEAIFREHKIFKHITKQYMNSGVLVINSKKIREDGKDKEIVEFLKNDPPTNFNNKIMQGIWMDMESKKIHPNITTFQLTDQSVLNYLFTDKVKIVSPVFNNMLGFMNNICYQKQICKLWGFENFQDFFEKSIIYHINVLKPWQIVPENKFILNQYFQRAVKKYNDIKKEMEEVLK